MGKKEMKQFLRSHPQPPRNDDEQVLVDGTEEEIERFKRRIGNANNSRSR